MRIHRFAVILCAALVAPAFLFGAGNREDEPTSTAAMERGKYGEAPMLAEMVAAGELPPVEERLPIDPAVVWFAPGDSVGKYGGTMNVIHTSQGAWNDLADETESGGYLVRMDPFTGEFHGSLAAGFDLADDFMSLTFYLREGTKWSDGHPMTADDIVFMYEAAHWNELVTTWNWIPQIRRVVKIDDYTVRMEVDEPYPALLFKHTSPPGGGWNTFHPKHYLEKWHIEYNPDANELAEEEGFDSWAEAFNHHFFWAPLNDLDQPTHHPWKVTEVTTTGKSLERNPYYWKIDPEGNQLPYVDSIHGQIVDGETYQLKVIAGEADYAVLNTRFENYTLYQENAAAGDYRVVQIKGPMSATVMLNPNYFHEDPFTRETYRDVRFRRALSLAIDREEINDLVYFGVGTPAAATIVSSSPYFKEEWLTAYAEHDLDRASAMLDQIGLTATDRDGFRTHPDGDAFLQILEYDADAILPVLELIKEYFQAVGLKTEIRFIEGVYDRGQASLGDIYVRHTVRSGEFREWSDAAASTEWESHFFAYEWGIWMRAQEEIDRGEKTLADFADGMLPGEEPPDEIKANYQAKLRWALNDIGSPEYIDGFQELFDNHADKMYLIGTVAHIPHIGIFKNNVRNYPTLYSPDGVWGGDLLQFADKLFFE